MIKSLKMQNTSFNIQLEIKQEKAFWWKMRRNNGSIKIPPRSFYSIETTLRFMYLNLHTSSKKSSALLWLLFIWRILILIFFKFLPYLIIDSRVLIFCSAFSGDLTVITTSSRLGITNLESTCKISKGK